MAASTKLRWKQCVNELRFVSEECEIVQEIASTAAREFQEYYEDFCRRHEIDLETLNHTHGQKLQELYKEKSTEGADEHSNPDPDGNCALVLHSSPSKEINREQHPEIEEEPCDYQMTKDDIEMHETFAKVFKKLALVLHPDKLSNELSPAEIEEKTQMFTDCTKALDERRYFLLIDLAERFKISFPRNYRQQIRWMKKETARIEQEIKQHQKTYNYIFADADTDEDKDNVIRQFMTQIFGAEIFHQ